MVTHLGSLSVSPRELTLIRKLLTAQAAHIRADAPARVASQPHRLVAEGMADILEMAASNCDELAERLSFAVPGEAIRVAADDENKD